MTDAPRILFGIGAAKAGTGLLYEWLSGHPECHFRSVKELHYFDTLAEGRAGHRALRLRGIRDALLLSNGPRGRIEDLSELARVFDRPDNLDGYLAYMDRGREGRKIVGDITPAYALLPQDDLAAMADLGDTRFIYILRDPVDRLWSHVRMIASRREEDRSVTRERADRIFVRTLKGKEDHILARSNYKTTIERLCRAVPEERRMVLFFDDLVSGDAAPRICDFLGIGRSAPPEKIVHRGGALEMTPEQIGVARDLLAEQYAFVEDYMGRLPQGWRQTEGV